MKAAFKSEPDRTPAPSGTITTTELARRAGVHRTTVTHLRARGEITPLGRVSLSHGGYYFSAADAEPLIARLRRERAARGVKTEEVARRLGVTIGMISRLVRKGRLTPVARLLVGGAMVFRDEDVQQLVDERAGRLARRLRQLKTAATIEVSQ